MNALRKKTPLMLVHVAVAAGLLTPPMALAGAPRSAFEAKTAADAINGAGGAKEALNNSLRQSSVRDFFGA